MAKKRGTGLNDKLDGTNSGDLLWGLAGHDRIVGRAGKDQIIGGAGNDKLYGDADDDRLFGNDGNDFLYGGAGNDQLLGHAGRDRLYGDVGNDKLKGGADGDRLYGQRGNDKLFGEKGNDLIKGGDGRDSLHGSHGKDKLYGEKGHDFLNGGESADRLYGGSGNDRLQGGDGRDLLKGGSGNDRLYGQAGSDRLYGESGRDQLYGGDGHDDLYGGDGDDRLFGGDGDDNLWGGNGNDYLDGGGGNSGDWLFGDAGHDVFVARLGELALVDGGSGFDTLRLGHIGPDIALYSDDYDESAYFEAAASHSPSNAGSLTGHGSVTSTTTAGGFGINIDRVKVGASTYSEFYTPPDVTEDPPVEIVDAPPPIIAEVEPLYLDMWLSSIETIDLSGGGTNTLHLTAREIQELVVDDGALLIVGDVGDRVDAGDGWVHSSDWFYQLENATLYRNGMAYLQIADGIVLENAPAAPSGSVIVPGSYGAGAAQIDLASETTLVSIIDSGPMTADYVPVPEIAFGDLDGDGLADIVLASRFAEAGADAAFIVFGASVTPGAEPLINVSAASGIGTISGLNHAHGDIDIALVGDTNGDGIHDLLISGKMALERALVEPGVPLQRDSYLIRGTAVVEDLRGVLNTVDGTNGTHFSVTNELSSDFGAIVSAIGDINGDGLADYAIGSQWSSTGGRVANGGVFVVLGTNDDEPGLALDSPSHVVHELIGSEAYGLTGSAIASVGDFNGDGFDDFLVGAALAESYREHESPGAAFLIFGHGGYFYDDVLDPVGSTDLGTRIFLGISDLDEAGASVAGIGDFDGDGFDDIAIAAPAANPHGETSDNTGEVYIVYGSESRHRSARTLDETHGDNLTIVGVSAGDRFGQKIVGAGDFNGDGYGDFLITAPGTSSGSAANDSGSVYILFGGERNTGVRSIDSFEHNEVLQIYSGDISVGVGFGTVSGGEDVNGDGYDDVLISAPYVTATDTFGTKTYVIFGRSDFEIVDDESIAAVEFEGTSEHDTIIGTSESETLIGGLGNDTLDGKGGDDVLIGAAGDDRIVYDLQDSLRIDGGPGHDTLVLKDGASLSLITLAARGSGNILRGFEAVDLADGNVNAVAIDPASVLQLSDTSNSVRIFGDDGDFVLMDTTKFALPVEFSDESGTWMLYRAGAASVEIGANLTVILPSLAPPALNESTPFQYHEDDLNNASPDLFAGAHFLGDPQLLGIEVTDWDSTSDFFPDIFSRTNSNMLGYLGNEPLQFLDADETTTGTIRYEVRDAFGREAVGHAAFEFIGANDAPTIEHEATPAAIFPQYERPISFYNLTAQDLDSDIVKITIRFDGAYEPGADFLRGASGAEADTIIFDAEAGSLTITGSALNSFDTETLPRVSFGNASNNGFSRVAYEYLGATENPIERSFEIVVTDAHGATATAAHTIGIEMFNGGTEVTDILRPEDDADGHGYVLNFHYIYALGGNGDIDGDGLSDFVAAGSGLFGSDDRQVIQVYGTPNSVSDGFRADISDHTIETFVNPFVSQLEMIGDVNNDGFDDQLLSNTFYLGTVLLQYGDAVASSNTVATFVGERASSDLGSNLNALGDINGDGFADFAIAEGEGSSGNSMFVVFGRDETFAAETELSVDDTPTAEPELGFVFESTGRDASTPGTSIITAGDFNGDQIDDLLFDARTGNSDAATLFLAYGGAHVEDWNVLQPNALAAAGHGFEITDASGSFIIDRDWADFIGDFNGDGFDDIVVRKNFAGNPYVSPSQFNDPSWTAAVVVYGRPDSINSLDLRESNVLGDGALGFRILHSDPLDTTQMGLAGIGDINGDGFDDLAVGSPHTVVDGRVAAGRVTVIFGNADGAASVDPSSSTNAEVVLFDGYAYERHLGVVIEKLGDVNGDGYDDVYIGSPSAISYSNLPSDTGFVVYGRDYAGTVFNEGTTDDDTITGSENDDIIIGNLGNDILDGGLGNDTLKGAAGDDVLIYDPADTRAVDGGGGTDTLRFAGSGMVLDFDKVHALSSIEKIDLTGSGDNTVKFDIRDIIDLAGQAALFDDRATRQVLFDGDAGDSVESTGQGWEASDNVDVDGVFYVSYVHADIAGQILLDPDITYDIS